MNFGNSTPFEQAPTGIHKAKLFRIVDIGTQTGEWKGEPTKNRQLHFTWELVEELNENGKPFVISKFYNQSLGENSNFIKDLTSWLGTAPSIPSKKEEIAPFVEDLLKSLLGKGCQLIITEKEGKHKVSTVTGLGKSDKLPDGTVNELLIFDIDKFDEEDFAKLSTYLQGKIQDSPEYATVVGGEFSGPATAESDEIPF